MSESTPTPTDPREEKPKRQKITISEAREVAQQTLHAAEARRIETDDTSAQDAIDYQSDKDAEIARLAAEIAELKADVDRLTAARDEANESVTLNYNTILQLREIITETKAELEAARKELDRVYREFVSKDVLDTTLAAKDAAELERDAWERSSIAWQENHAKALERVDALWEELTAQRRLESWVIQLRGRGYIKAADSLIGGFLADIDKARALSPAPTQEPPAGGVTISNPL